MNTKQGILYIATGNRFRNEAIYSAGRVRELMPEVPLALASDQLPNNRIFSNTIPIDRPQGSFADKIAPLAQTPFAETIFLDTDAYLCQAVPELFEILKHYDIALAHAPMRQTGSVDVPATFPEFNSGVIAYRSNERVWDLFQSWGRFYEEQVSKTGQIDDQPALRRALWHSDVKISVLPPEYNFRFILPSFAGRGKVKILHGRHPNLPALEKIINRSGSPRVFLPRLRDITAQRFHFISLPGILFGRFLFPIAFLAHIFGPVYDGLLSRIKKGINNFNALLQ